MDVARTATDRDCTFFNDDPRVGRIHWYRAPDDAKFFPTYHKWGHLCWYSYPWESSGVGEVYGTREQWNPGFTPPTVAGQHFCGPLEAFQEGCTFDPDVNVERDTWGVAKACADAPDCFILMEESYHPLILQEDGTGISPEGCH